VCEIAAFAVACAEGRSISGGALPFASAAAALKIQRSGATDGMPLRDEVINYCDKQGITLSPPSAIHVFPLL
jgi:sugar/nucleoside kinase (ribokinase family)